MESKKIIYKYGQLWVNPPRKTQSLLMMDEYLFDYYQPSEGALHIRLSIYFLGRDQSGILGATLYPNENFIVEIPNPDGDNQVIENITQIISDNANLQNRKTPIPTGRLVFDYRYYHPIERSLFMVVLLTRCIVNCFSLNIQELTREDIEKLIMRIHDEIYNK